MAPLEVPATGLSLQRTDAPEGLSPENTTKHPQIMRLNLAQSTLDELVDSLRNEQKARIRLGKHQSLHYGSKSQPFFSTPETHPAEIYFSTATDNEHLYFSGALSHSLEVQRAKEATAATDEALANLEQSLSAFERGKESKKTHLISNINALRPGKQAALLARGSNASNRSTPVSPALGAIGSPSLAAHTPTSAPLSQNRDKIRLEAIKVPFIHLLAVRPVSVKFLAQQTRSSQEDCQALADKYGTENRLNREKYNLKDKTYKDLDVWKFPYPTPEERQEAIENAISAFDRMRISKMDKLWQMLLPKQERGKGKVLSRLNIRAGPAPGAGQKSVTPRINIQPSEDVPKDGYRSGNETDRTTGSRTPNAGDLAPPRPSTTTAKRRTAEKETAKRSATNAKPKNTTLTGKVTKKAADKKSNAKSEQKFKSAEYVHDSDADDDDVEMEDVPAPKPKHSKSTNELAEAKVARKPSPAELAGSKTAPASAPASAAPSKPPPQPTNAKSGATKTLPHTTSRTTNGNSPTKPSPLGSSPPTNASEFESTTKHKRQSTSGSNSSSSSTPLITQIKAPIRKQPITATVRAPESALSRKRKAEPEPETLKPRPMVNGHSGGHMMEPKRRRPSTPISSSSGSASPPMRRELLRQQLQEKSRQFKMYYAKYRALHDEMTAHAEPPRAQLEKLERQHAHLGRMKKEIWDEDRRLRSGA